MLSGLNYKLPRPKLQITDNLFNRIFGVGKVEIRPQGEINLIAGYQDKTLKTLPSPKEPEKMADSISI